MTNESPEQPLDASNAKTTNDDNKRRSNMPVWGLVFGLASGVLAWCILQSLLPFYTFPSKYVYEQGPPNAEIAAEAAAVLRSVHKGNRTIAAAIIGALLGASLGVAEALARGSKIKTLPFAIAGALIVAATGYAGGLGADSLQLSRETLPPPLSLGSIAMVQAVFWAVLGAGAGIAVGALNMRAQSMGSCLVAGIAAGAVGGVLYSALVNVLIPVAQPQFFIPIRADSQLLWIALPTSLIGTIVYFAARQNSATAVNDKSR